MVEAATWRRWLPYGPAPGGTRLTLICLPYAGGRALAFRGWDDELPCDIWPAPVEYPGRGGQAGEPPLGSVQAVADALADVLLPFRDRPLALFGHSFGALVAFELACRLGDAGIPPEHLLLAGCRAPSHPPLEPPAHDLPTPEFRRRVQSWGGMPDAVAREPALLALIEPVLRADLRAADTYAASSRAPPACPTTAFAGLADPLAPPAAMAGWGMHVAGPFTLHHLPGDHFFPTTSRQMLLALVSRALGDR